MSGEEAVAAQSANRRTRTPPAGAIDFILAASALVCCFYVAIRYPELIRELVARPWSGVSSPPSSCLLVFEASRRVTGLALVLIVLALCAHALLGWMLPEMFASRSGRR